MEPKKCKNCGTVYSNQYKVCPQCGYSPLKDKAKDILKYLMVLLIIVTCVYTMYTLNNIKTNVNYIKSMFTIDTSGVDTQQYLNENILYDGMVLDNLGDEYLIYFYDETNQSADSNTYIDMFIQMGVINKYPVYFVTPSTGPETIEKFSVDTYPTIIHMVAGKEKERASTGADIYNTLDVLVTEYANSIANQLQNFQKRIFVSKNLESVGFFPPSVIEAI